MSLPGIVCLGVSSIALTLFYIGIYLINKWKNEENKND